MADKSTPIDSLRRVMVQLRDPAGGCPWDRAQTHATIAPHTIEEAYEVAHAVRTGDAAALCDELGDLLFQVVFQARIAEEAGAFDFDDVARAITAKMHRRHPHVFGDTVYENAAAQAAGWEAIKAAEKSARGGDTRGDDAGDARSDARSNNSDGIGGIAPGLPALIRAMKLQKHAARAGFDWREAGEVIAKIREETGEVAEEIPHGDHARIREELGDLLFAVVNLARKTGCDPEDALAHANEKFTRRFAAIEAAAAEKGKKPEACSLDEMEAWWQAAK